MSIRRSARHLGVVIAMTASAVLAACGSSSNNTTSSSSGAAANATCNTPGFSPTSVSVGFIYPASGATAGQRTGYDAGVNARVQMQNDSGGVFNRTVSVATKDDLSTASGDLDGVRNLVENQGVFGVMSATVVDGSSQYVNANDIPLIGYVNYPAYDGRYKQYIGVTGEYTPTNGISSSTMDFFKSKGVTNVALLAVNVTQAVTSAQGQAVVAKQDGMKATQILNVPLVPGDFTALVGQIKDSGADGVYLSTTNAVGIALYKQLAQAGVKFKVFMFPTFYDPVGLAQVAQQVDGTYTAAVAPFELNTPEYQSFAAGMKKYQPNAPVNQFSLNGWLNADLFILGLQRSGNCPTRDSFISTVRGIKDWNGHGELPPVNFNKPQLCGWFLQISAGKYVPEETQPACGKLVTVG